MGRYRIGDFARELGVTPDFLKYCEKNGFLQPEVGENGYRFFDFRQSALAIEYLKMKNQGCTAREIKEALYASSFEEFAGQTQRRREGLRRMLCFYEELLRYYDWLEGLEGCFGEPPLWHIRRIPGFYFLPHSRGAAFLSDEAIHERVRDWNRWLPVVMSTNRYRVEGPGWEFSERVQNCWGFSVEEGFARAQGLMVDGPVEYVKPGRYLELFVGQSLSGGEGRMMEAAAGVLGQNGLRPCGNVYMKVVAKLWEAGTRREYGILYVPVAEA